MYIESWLQLERKRILYTVCICIHEYICLYVYRKMVLIRGKTYTIYGMYMCVCIYIYIYMYIERWLQLEEKRIPYNVSIYGCMYVYIYIFICI
jgi:hypothetical protein